MAVETSSLTINPEVFIYSDSKELVKNLFEKLLGKRCIATLVLDSDKQKKNYTQSDLIASIQEVKNKVRRSPEKLYYIICVGNSENKDLKKASNTTSTLIELIKKNNSKALFVLPYNQLSTNKNLFRNITERILNDRGLYAGIIYTGELFEFGQGSFNGIFKKNTLVLPDKETAFYPVASSDLSEFLISSLFSMRAYKKKTSFLGDRLLSSQIAKIQKDYFPGLKVKYTSDAFSEGLQIEDKVSIYTNANGLLIDFLNSIPKVYSKPGVSPRKLNFRLVYTQNLTKLLTSLLRFKKTVKRPRLGYLLNIKKLFSNFGSKLIVVCFSFFILVIVFPFALMLTAQASLFISPQLTNRGYTGTSMRFLALSATLLNTSQKYSSFFENYLPQLGIYKSSYSKSQIIKTERVVQEDFNRIVDNWLMLVNKDDQEGNDNFEKFGNISLELVNLYNNLGFLQSETSGKDKLNNIKNPLFSGGSISPMRDKVLSLSKLFKEGETVLGKNKPAKYLLLLKNNQELRPTGGKIVAFAVFAISEGKVVNFAVYDTNYADSKLSGKVEPPKELSLFFGKDAWLFEDSDWSSDFPSTAQKAEWFLDKELDLIFDGVISMDTEALDFLSEDLRFREDSLNISEGNFDVALDNFFGQLSNIDKRKGVRLMSALTHLLKRKHILFYLYDDRVEEAVRNLGWSGEVRKFDCNQPCYSDLVGIVEVGKSLGSLDISREVSLEISFEENLIKRNLTLYLENNGESKYEAYIRILANSDSGFSPAKVVSQEGENQLVLGAVGQEGYKETGGKIEIAPDDVKAFKVSWESGVDDFSKLNEYKLLIRSQPGVAPFPVAVIVSGLKDSAELINMPAALTKGAELRYNTDLNSDYLIEIPINK